MANNLLGIAYELSGNNDSAAMAIKKARELSDEPAFYNASLMVLALEENNRALIDEYWALFVNSESNLNKTILALFDKPEEAVAELKPYLTDPAYNSPMGRMAIIVWASYFGEYDFVCD